MFEKTKILMQKFRMENLSKQNYQTQSHKITESKIRIMETKRFSDSNKQDLNRVNSKGYKKSIRKK
ncbi:MAG: hypothetical protein ACI4U0_05875 [Candidatus Aphodocola sp.]